jgi:hypothetical protein
LGAPNGTDVPLAVINNGPKTPNPRPVVFVALSDFRESDGHLRTAMHSILNA